MCVSENMYICPTAFLPLLPLRTLEDIENIDIF